jgi:ethanolamine transporter EutH
VSTGAVLAVVATILVMVVYGYYAFYLKKDLGDNLTALAQTILAAGFGGFAATEITKIKRGP